MRSNYWDNAKHEYQLNVEASKLYSNIVFTYYYHIKCKCSRYFTQYPTPQTLYSDHKLENGMHALLFYLYFYCIT